MEMHEQEQNFENRESTNRNLKTERKKIDGYLNEMSKHDDYLALFFRERKTTDASLNKERLESDNATIAAEKSRDETKDALATRDRFIAVVSHDLKNPLAAVLLSTKLLRNILTSLQIHDNKVEKCLNVIEQSAVSMDHMISDLLDVERIKNNKMSINRKECELCGLLQEALVLHLPLAKTKSIELRIGFCSPIMVNIDHDRILQVLANLLGNAIKFTPAGGKITLSVQKFEKFVEVSVTDTGLGVPMNLRKKVFDRFSQLKERDSRGLGLGLYIAKWIVEEHQGQIWISDNEFGGSVFTFSLPQHIFSA